MNFEDDMMSFDVLKSNTRQTYQRYITVAKFLFLRLDNLTLIQDPERNET